MLTQCDIFACGKCDIPLRGMKCRDRRPRRSLSNNPVACRRAGPWSRRGFCTNPRLPPRPPCVKGAVSANAEAGGFLIPPSFCFAKIHLPFQGRLLPAADSAQPRGRQIAAPTKSPPFPHKTLASLTREVSAKPTEGVLKVKLPQSRICSTAPSVRGPRKIVRTPCKKTVL